MPIVRHAATTVAQALLSLLFALALTMLARRAGGAFVQPLGGLTFVTVAVALVVIAAAARMMLFDSVAGTRYSVLGTQYLVPSERPSILAGPSVVNTGAPLGPLLFALPGLASAVLLAALTLPGTPTLAIAFAWFVLIGVEGLSWLAARRALLGRSVNGPRAVLDERPTDGSRDGLDAELPAGLVQQLTRVRDESRESIHAVLLAEIPLGDRQTAIHIAFCPPLEVRPEMSAHALDADDADVRVTNAETFGARIEVRLRAIASQRRRALVELIGWAANPQMSESGGGPPYASARGMLDRTESEA